MDDRIDHFRVIRPLGAGGTAEVFLARDETLGRKVALKVIRSEVLGGDVARFLREAQTTARFNHPNIVTIHAVGEHDGRPYLALEYVEGDSLRRRIERDRPTPTETLRIGLTVAEALVEAHRAGVLHRDLKPENVIMARDGRPRVVDFGLAGAAPPEDAGEALASTVEGTPGYMAPEQWEGRTTSEKTDVWALGVMLHEMLTGHRPFEAPTVAELARRVCSAEPAPRLGNDLDRDAGPAGTIVVGFEDGTVGMWIVATGAYLHAERVHGRPIHLLAHEGKLYAATDLGDYLVWDLDVYSQEYCALVESVWADVDVVVEEGKVKARRPREGHACRRGS